MSSKMDVKSFWDDRARNEALSENAVTHPDVWQRWLEVETLKRFLRPTDRVLDVGCGNGHTTREIATLTREVVGVDYSEEMVRRAQSTTAPNLPVTFRQADATTLDAAALGTFDVAISERCLINLKSWEDQKRAIAAIASVLADGGRFIFIEGSARGRAQLNDLRTALGLAEMPRVWHNIDFDEEALFGFIEPLFEVTERVDLGVYDLVARVIHPLFVAPKPPQYDSRLNELAARAADSCRGLGGISRLLFLVLTRRTRR